MVKLNSRGRFCSRECYWQGKEGRAPLEARLWSRVERVDDPEACWLWAGTRNNKGYGRIHLGPRQGTALVHRVAWEIAYGPIPAGLLVCHTCDTPLCVRPTHLFLGTNAENMADMAGKGPQAKGERTKPKQMKVGSRLPQAKLTEVQALQIRQRYAGGRVLMAELAEAFGVSVPTVHNIIRRKSWNHVP